MHTFQLIWTRGAITDWQKERVTRRRLMHTISNVDAGAVDAFARQMRPGTPYILVANGCQRGGEQVA